MATEAQTCAIGILPNRRNAPKSAGPRTNRLSSPACQKFMTLIMQNKANFPKDKTNANLFAKKDYENKPRLRAPGKQTQSNPISKAKKMLLRLTINGRKYRGEYAF